MKKLYQKINWPAIWLAIKPSLTIVAIFLILHHTGAFSGILQFSQTTMMKAGFMDATPNVPAVVRGFNYNFKLKDMNGNIVNAEDFKNKTLFINLWATWCGPCRSEMPSIENLYKKVDSKKIAFIMLSLDDPNADQKVKKFTADHQYTFPIYRPVDGLPSQLNVTSIPTTFIVSPEGKIVSKKIGAASYDNKEFQEYLENVK